MLTTANHAGFFSVLLCVLAIVASPAADASPVAPTLFTDAGPVLSPRSQQVPYLAARHVRVDDRVLHHAMETRSPAQIRLPDGSVVSLEPRRSFRNRSGSLSWICGIEGDPRGLAVLVHRAGVTVGSIRTGGQTYILYYSGLDAGGQPLHSLCHVDLDDAFFVEDEPTEVELQPSQRRAGEQRRVARMAGDEPQDDGSIQDLMVVYTPMAADLAGGTVAIENLIDLGVTETNLSYENSGVHHRIRLVYKGQIDYDESIPHADDLRDRLQMTDDGHMDEVHPIRDQVKADLVKLVYGGYGCGRAFIMGELSLAHAEYAFDRTNQQCISPYYSFQHELGHVQGGRHSWIGDANDNAPFTFNHGYRDIDNEFHTIMATSWQQGCSNCVRLLYWSNPDIDEPVSGAPMGVAEGQPQAADNRKTLNMTAWTVANFRVSNMDIFSDDFES